MPENQIIFNKLNDLQADLSALLEAQQISNYLAMSTNPKIPVEIQEQALDKALAMQGLSRHQSQAASQFVDALPSDVLGR